MPLVSVMVWLAPEWLTTPINNSLVCVGMTSPELALWLESLSAFDWSSGVLVAPPRISAMANDRSAPVPVGLTVTVNVPAEVAATPA